MSARRHRRDTVISQAQIKAYEASAAAIAATISAKVAEKGDRMPDGMVPIVQEFMRTYLDVVAKQKRDPMEKVPVLKEYLGLVEDQLDEPFVFAPYHEAWTEENGAPIDHLKMDTAFMEPMLDPADSVLLGSERVKDIEELLAKGDNVVLLSNHQTEADPSCWSFALHENHERLERDMIMVAGDRVTTDVVAVPFSKARNLLCIYSKRHIDNPPEEKPKKMRHNAKTMTVCLRRPAVRHRRDSGVVFRSISGPFRTMQSPRCDLLGRGDGVGLIRHRRDSSEGRDYEQTRSRRVDGVPRHCSHRPCSASSRAAASASGSRRPVEEIDLTLMASIHRPNSTRSPSRCSGS